ncbi:MAG: TRAP transporter small permease [Sphaerochaetaceae bacterium]|jgi:TRAP-type C4-dicarboxylate transport system permease small subunit|nr:TRAP transporter small permease [Sphaerochaetaceae bacterium]MDX9809782.1 TRAP transporter small permease [Sphaerochaetaceae bacterium]
MLKKIEKGLEYLSALLLAVMLFAILLQISARMLLDIGFGWTEELARYMMVWLTYVGAVVSVRQGTHIAIDLVVRKFSPKWQKIIALIGSLCVLFFLIVMIVQALKLNSSTAIKRQLSPGLQMPIKYLYGVIPICGIGMLLAVVTNMVETIVRLFKRENE